MSNLHGTFGWYELMTTDAAAAAAFYADVVGWTAQDSGMPDQAYTLFLAGETRAAGLMTLSQAACDQGARPGWIGYVLVDDVDAYAKRVTEAGGAVHVPPTDIPEVGRFAMVADPQGAAFALFKGLDDAPPTAAGVGQVGWRELMAVDGDAAFAFYSGLFGWTPTQRIDMGPMGAYQLFAGAGGGVDLGGMMTKPAQVPVPFWTYYFEVDGIQAAVARLTAGGGTVINGPHQVPGGAWIVQGTDPQGAIFSLTSGQA